MVTIIKMGKNYSLPQRIEDAIVNLGVYLLGGPVITERGDPIRKPYDPISEAQEYLGRKVMENLNKIKEKIHVKTGGRNKVRWELL